MMRRPPRSTLFPSTALSRSLERDLVVRLDDRPPVRQPEAGRARVAIDREHLPAACAGCGEQAGAAGAGLRRANRLTPSNLLNPMPAFALNKKRTDLDVLPPI